MEILTTNSSLTLIFEKVSLAPFLSGAGITGPGTGLLGGQTQPKNPLTPDWNALMKMGMTDPAMIEKLIPGGLNQLSALGALNPSALNPSSWNSALNPGIIQPTGMVTIPIAARAY